MSNITRWEPVREMMTLREAMDRLFDDAFTRPVSMSGSSIVPAIDLYQNDDEVVLKASLPGLNSDDVQITITSDVLTLKGEYKEDEDRKEKTFHIREHRFGIFERSIRLPSEVQADKSKAIFDNGVLTVVLPKAEVVRPKVITIKAK